MKRLSLWAVGLFALLLLAWAIVLRAPQTQPTSADPSSTPPKLPIVTSTHQFTPALAATPSATPLTPDTGWVLLRPGLERRVINLLDPQGALMEQLYLLRLEPAGYQFGVAYHARQPQSLVDWQAETQALLVLNGGYYRTQGKDFLPAGLLIVDRQVIGYSYGAFAGMLAVTTQGPEIRWLQQWPYTPGEPLIAGLQSFPLLIKPGGALGFPEQYEDGQKARRTVLGQDRAGRILILVANHDYFTLHQLSAYLAKSDLDLDIALNLDGGPSSGLLLADPAESIAAYSLLPIVITVQVRASN